MTEVLRVYKGNIVALLAVLADLEYQQNIWLNQNNPNKLVDSFDEAVNMLFDDSAVGYYLDKGHILFDKAVTQALQELGEAVDAVNEFRTQEEIINSPEMQTVREKAARALALIKASDGSESTVEIVE